MELKFFGKASESNSFLAKIDPRVKLITIFVFILAVVLTPTLSWYSFAAFFAILAGLVLISRLSPLYIVKRSLVIVPFVLLIAIFIPFFKEGEVAGSYNLWLWEVSITYSGLEILANVLIKAWLSIVALIILSATTNFVHLLKGLEKLTVPKVIVMLLSFMYRYSFVLVDEVTRLRQARDSRNFGGHGLRQIKAIGDMIGNLFLRSYEKAERIYVAMLARGFDGQFRTLNPLIFTRLDALFATVFLLLIGFTCLFFWG